MADPKKNPLIGAFRAPVPGAPPDTPAPPEAGKPPAAGAAKPTQDELYQYELRPSRDNPDVRQTMKEQAQVVGRWEDRNSIRTDRRLTRCVGIGAYICGDCVTPEELARRYRLAEDLPFISRRGPRPQKSPQIEGR